MAERLKVRTNWQSNASYRTTFLIGLYIYKLIFMQFVHISVTAVKQEMDKLKDREKWFVSGTRELELYGYMCINEQTMCFEIVFLSFGAAAQRGL